ncbi:MAG TPA: DNA-processing protein DprA [Blastocatellia bacterium]|nr:DNA-processing protein DprA [Blastocatellia bacterium]
MNLKPDSRAALLLTSRLGLEADSELDPLSRRDWNQLERNLSGKGLSPGSLEGLGANEIRAGFDLDGEQAERIARLLARGSELDHELERLESLGIWVLTRADQLYPDRYRLRLKDAAPIVLFGAGNRRLLGATGLAVAGSRNVDEAGRACAEFVGGACSDCGLVLYSGAARGVDSIAMGAALESGGSAVGVLADSLEKAARNRGSQDALEQGSLALVTSYSPNTVFSVGIAMGRNKLIYALADWGLVVASDAEKGGTWAGAAEVLKNRWVPLFVRGGEDVPEGNRLLINAGARTFEWPFRRPGGSLQEWLEANSNRSDETPVQFSLF